MSASSPRPSDGLGIRESSSASPLPAERGRPVSSSAGYGPCNQTHPPTPVRRDNHSLCRGTGFAGRPPLGWVVPREYFPELSRPTSCPVYWHRSPRLPRAHPPHRSTENVSCPIWPDRWDSCQSIRLPAELWSWCHPLLARSIQCLEVRHTRTRQPFRDPEKHPSSPSVGSNDATNCLSQSLWGLSSTDSWYGAHKRSHRELAATEAEDARLCGS